MPVYRISVIVILILLVLDSCNFVTDEADVTYLVTGAASGFDVRYRDAEGVLVLERIQAGSESDVWQYDFTADAGEILFISARYYDINSGIRIRILLDGKIFREASSRFDTSAFVVVSGTIPY